MTFELRTRHQTQNFYVNALSSAWRGSQLYDPTLWLTREPELEEKMLRDADIAHAIDFRSHLIAGNDWTVTPTVEGSERSPLVVQVATDLLGSVKHFTEARLNLARAFFSGARFGIVHGEAKTLTLGDGQPRTWWVPRRIEDVDKRSFRIAPSVDADGVITAQWERWDVGRMRWIPQTAEQSAVTIRHVYRDDAGSLGHGRGLREALGWWWYAKTHVFDETLTAVERFSQGLLRARIDGARDADTGLPNETVIREWRDLLEDLRGRHVLVHDKEDDVDMISLDGTGWQMLSDVRAELRTTITTLILGANLTTGASEGGSYALARVQENSTEALVQFDRSTLEETLTDDLIGCIWRKNWPNLVELGIAQEPPRFTIAQEKRQDPVQRAQVAQIVSGMGVQLSLAEVLEQTGFSQPEPGEPIVEPQAQPQPGALPGLFRA